MLGACQVVLAWGLSLCLCLGLVMAFLLNDCHDDCTSAMCTFARMYCTLYNIWYSVCALKVVFLIRRICLHFSVLVLNDV